MNPVAEVAQLQKVLFNEIQQKSIHKREVKAAEKQADGLRDTLATRNADYQREKMACWNAMRETEKQKAALFKLRDDFDELKVEYRELKEGGTGFVGMADHIALEEKYNEAAA